MYFKLIVVYVMILNEFRNFKCHIDKKNALQTNVHCFAASFGIISHFWDQYLKGIGIEHVSSVNHLNHLDGVSPILHRPLAVKRVFYYKDAYVIDQQNRIDMSFI